MDRICYDQRLARWLARPLAATPVTPNHVTGLSLVLGLSGAGLFATGEPVLFHWAAGLFVLARFLDNLDGELARVAGRSSRFGYYFDYVTGGLSYVSLFLGLGVGLTSGPIGDWALVLGIAGAASALISLFLNLDLDRHVVTAGQDTVGYPRLAGFDLEDGTYLLAPVTWLGWLPAFFVAAGLGATVYLLWTGWRVLRARGLAAINGRSAEPS